MTNPEPLLQLPDNVVQDVRGYRNKLQRFLDGEISDIAFKAYRVPMGVYEQRESGRFMVRVRLPAGLAWPYQLRRVAELSRQYGNGVPHVTTRQDIQIHDVALSDTANVQEGLLEAGLSARGGGGNTVRNITACPTAGACPGEAFDVRPYAIALAEYLLAFKSSYNLPRKFKVAFACREDEDGAMASVTDLGFFARTRDGRRGFKVLAGGGLGSNPRVGVLLEEWVEDTEFVAVAEAVKRLFDKHGDRSNKHAARLRYVLDRLGAEQFRSLYLSEREALRTEGLAGPIPELRPIPSSQRASGDAEPVEIEPSPNVLPEKTPGFYTIRLNLLLGDISADVLASVADVAEQSGDGLVRATQQQDLLIAGVPSGKVGSVLDRVNELGEDVLGANYPSIVACAGASTCKLGLCLSRNLAKAIVNRMREARIAGDKAPPIRISGCPNSCGNHYVAALGFGGKARRVEGRLMPFYDVFVGGVLGADGARLGQSIGAVPARAVPDMLVEAIADEGGHWAAALEGLIDKYAVPPEPIPDEYFMDWGRTEPFSLAGRGPGECGAGVMDIVEADIGTARAALSAAERADEPEKSSSTYEAVIAAARALLPLYGDEFCKDREILAAFDKRLLSDGWVDPDTRGLLDAAVDWRMGDSPRLGDLLQQAAELIERIEALFKSVDSNLNFRLTRVVDSSDDSEADDHPGDAADNVCDLRGVKCPMNFVKAKAALEGIPIGESLDVLLDDGEPIRNVPASFAEQGQTVVDVEAAGEHFRLRVRREK